MIVRAPATEIDRHHRHEHREPASGFASRLAAVNGRTMDVFLRDMAIHPRKIDKGEREAVRVLAQIGGASAAELERYTPYPNGARGFHILAGEILGPLAVRRTNFSFCPLCVANDLESFPGPIEGRPWLRLQWTISHFRSCDAHNMYFVDAHPVRRRFEPFDFNETLEPLLPQIGTLAEGAGSASVSPFQQWLTRRLDGHRDSDLWLDRFPLYVGAEWCEALGVSALHAPKVRTSQFGVVQWADAADEGYRISSFGEKSIRALLSRLALNQKDTRGFWGLRDTFGYAYGLLQKTVGDPEFGPIRTLVREFADGVVPIEPGSEVLGEVIERPRISTVRSIARATGVHDRTIRRLVDRENLAHEAIRDGLRNHRVALPTDVVADTVTRLKDALTGPQVRALLGGIFHPHLMAIVAAGGLSPIGGSERQANAKHRFARADVDAMLARLFDDAEEVLSPGPRQMSVEDARHAAGAQLEMTLSSVFSGELKWRGRLAGRHDYLALLIDADELTALVRSEPAMYNHTRRDVHALLGFSSATIDILILKGLLVITSEFSPAARRKVEVITRASVEAFVTKYVTLGQLRDASGLHIKQVKLLLKGVLIEPAHDPDEIKVWLYSRKEVDRVVNAVPTFWAYDKTAAQAAAG